jgi:hypothetical protein
MMLDLRYKENYKTSFYQDLFFHYNLWILIELVSLASSFLQINIPTKACGLQQESHFKVLWFQDNPGSGTNQQQALPEDEVDPELARYLNRSYWEQRQSEEAQQHEKQIHHISDRNGTRVGSPLSQQPSAPVSSLSTSNKLVSWSTSIVLNATYQPTYGKAGDTIYCYTCVISPVYFTRNVLFYPALNQTIPLAGY